MEYFATGERRANWGTGEQGQWNFSNLGHARPHFSLAFSFLASVSSGNNDLPFSGARNCVLDKHKQTKFSSVVRVLCVYHIKLLSPWTLNALSLLDPCVDTSTRQCAFRGHWPLTVHKCTWPLKKRWRVHIMSAATGKVSRHLNVGPMWPQAAICLKALPARKDVYIHE